MLWRGALMLWADVVTPHVVTVVMRCDATDVVAGAWWQAYIPGTPVFTVDGVMRRLCRNVSVTVNLSADSLACGSPSKFPG